MELRSSEDWIAQQPTTSEHHEERRFLFIPDQTRRWRGVVQSLSLTRAMGSAVPYGMERNYGVARNPETSASACRRLYCRGEQFITRLNAVLKDFSDS